MADTAPDLCSAIDPSLLLDILQHAADAIVVLDHRSRILLFNHSAEAMFGYPAREVLGREIDVLLPASVAQAHRLRLNAWALSAEPIPLVGSHDIQGMRQDGSLFPASVTISSLNHRENPLFIATLRDISAERRMREELQFRESFEQLIASLSTKFISLPSDVIDGEIHRTLQAIGTFIDADRSYVFRLSRDGTRISNTYEWCAPGIAPQIDLLQSLPVTTFPWWMEKLRRAENISVPHVDDLPPEAAAEKEILQSQDITSLIVVPMIYGPHLIGFLGFDAVRSGKAWGEDSTRLLRMAGNILAHALVHREAEDALRASEARLKLAMEATSDGLWDWNMVTDEMYLDPQCQRMLGYVPGEMSCTLQMWQERVHPSELDRTMRALYEHLQSRTAQFQSEYRLRTRSGSWLWVMDRGKVVEWDAQGQPVRMVGTKTDISERVRLEQVKSDLVNRVSHELRTPLTTAMMMANLIQEGGTPEDLAQYWQILNLELKRQRDLVEDLLTVGCLESGRSRISVVPLRPHPILEAAIETIAPQAKSKSIELRISIAQDLPMVQGNRTMLAQAFTNLLHNAVKFTPAGGWIAVNARCDDRLVRVQVCDSGIGIPRDELPYLFERFFRASNAEYQEVPGSGLGLYIVRSIVEELGGHVTVDSDLDQGATFEIRLPHLPDGDWTQAQGC